MNITIYQIIPEQDYQDLIFRDLKSIYAACQNRVPAEIYENVYHSEINAETLEDIFYIFNMRHPEDYRGRSLSVSDVVEVYGQEAGSSFYFCDRFGFEKIDFDRNKAVIRDHQDNRKGRGNEKFFEKNGSGFAIVPVCVSLQTVRCMLPPCEAERDNRDAGCVSAGKTPAGPRRLG